MLATLDADGRLAGHYRLAAVRAYLYEMAADYTVAISHYRAAAARTTSIPERNYLIAQAVGNISVALTHVGAAHMLISSINIAMLVSR
jgi:predicted RNA polymerase sigma factor